MGVLVARHDELLAAAIEDHGGAVVKTEGDAFFAAFADAAVGGHGGGRAQRAVAAEAWGGGVDVRVRMGLHMGEGRLRTARNPGDAEDYVGIDVNYAARIAAAGNGGQIVVSRALVDALPVSGASIAGLADVELTEEACVRSRTSTSRCRSTGWSSPARPTTRDRCGRPTRRPTCRAT